jgi:hypothetical protein
LEDQNVSKYFSLDSHLVGTKKSLSYQAHPTKSLTAVLTPMSLKLDGTGIDMMSLESSTYS